MTARAPSALAISVAAWHAIGMFMRTALLASLLAAPVAAQQAMSADEFEAYVTGKTLDYESGGVAYGVEEYRSDRRVRWSFLDGECKDGAWYEADGLICFVYEDQDGAQCWSFFQGPTGLRAQFAGDEPGTDIYETRARDEPLQCLGPKVGV